MYILYTNIFRSTNLLIALACEHVVQFYSLSNAISSRISDILAKNILNLNYACGPPEKQVVGSATQWNYRGDSKIHIQQLEKNCFPAFHRAPCTHLDSRKCILQFLFLLVVIPHRTGSYRVIAYHSFECRCSTQWAHRTLCS